MLKSGYKGDILSIEPSSSAYEVLIKNSKSYSNWRIFRRCAIGSSTGKVILNLSKNSQSSSILDISDEHVKFANDSVYVGSETIDMITVDYLYDELQLQNRRIFLKVDTQGYEGEVLLGSIKSIHTFTFVSLELSTTQLYIGAPNYYELMSTMSSHGFVLFSMEPVFFDNKSGRVLQYDAIFINSRSL
jgi:FkbM family methyltransferase